MSVTYKRNTIPFDKFLLFFTRMDYQFIMALSGRIDLFDYAVKLYNNAVLFEAYSESNLIGIVACYANDKVNKKVFISLVFVQSDFRKQGIAKKLLKNCLLFLNDNDFERVGLEVDKKNISAQSLYRKMGFNFKENKENSWMMERQIISNSSVLNF